MERHTYMLPRYDDAERMVSQGHALAAEAGIPCLLRRTYKKHPVEPAPPSAYDFITYFECADADVPTFHASARRCATSPRIEWKSFAEGPTWHGRRVATWGELFA